MYGYTRAHAFSSMDIAPIQHLCTYTCCHMAWHAMHTFVITHSSTRVSACIEACSLAIDPHIGFLHWFLDMVDLALNEQLEELVSE